MKLKIGVFASALALGTGCEFSSFMTESEVKELSQPVKGSLLTTLPMSSPSPSASPRPRVSASPSPSPSLSPRPRVSASPSPSPSPSPSLSPRPRVSASPSPSVSPSPSPRLTPSPAPTSGAGIIFYDGAEKAPTINYGPQPPTYWSGSPGHASVGSLTVDTNIRRKGNSSYKIVLKNNGTTNTPYEYLKKELAWNFLPAGTNAATAQQLGQPDATNRPLLNLRWMSMSVYLPSNFQDNTRANGFGIGFNTKAIPDDYPTPTHVYTYNGRFVLMVNNGVNPAKSYDLGPVQLGVWTDFVMNRNFTSSANGFIRMYRDGKLVAEHLGNNWRDGPGYAKEAYVQMGAYQFQWNNPNPITERVIYIDEIRFGNDRATLQDFLID